MQELTRHESGKEVLFSERFDLRCAVQDATRLYIAEASRRRLVFDLDLARCPQFVIGDSKKVRMLVANLTANAGKDALTV